MLLSAFITIPLVMAMAVSVYTDLRRRLIYDWITLPGIAYFLLFHAIDTPQKWSMFVLGVIVVGGISLMMALISQGQLGGGDIKLLALVGAAVGWQAGLLVMVFTYLLAGICVIPVWIASKVSGALVMGGEIPLAPFIAGGTCLFLLLARFNSY